LLCTGGILALSYVASEWGRSTYAQRQGSLEFAELRQNPRPITMLHEGALYGRVAIRSLELSAIVFEGVEEKTLAKGVGHLPIAENGNRRIVLAGHRDTFFRPLREIQVGDPIELSMPQGTNIYTVTSTAVVDPDNTDVIQATGVPMLTLITCYPFSFLGPAPQRFIVDAVLTHTR
jgi:sortase A